MGCRRFHHGSGPSPTSERKWEASRLPEPVYEHSIRGDGTLSAPGPSRQSSALRDIVQVIDDRILTFDPRDQDASRSFCERGFLPPGTKRYKDKRFMFDRVFNNEAQQLDVYESTAKPLLTPLLDGFNATIFAYGATGCGKTHTISGTETDPGIIYLTMAELFQRIEDRREDYEIEVIVTFLEIYNEEIRDLLNDPDTPAPRGGLQIREDKTVKVSGLTELKPRTAEQVKEIVLAGNLRRTQSPTLANETSSRSHAVLQIHVTQSPRTANVTEERTMGTLSIIDLAGSERAAATTNMGQRMVEGANINKSLLALGNCINALCESGGAVRHIPYRNSKLTRLLKFSLGGNCKTVMIVCVAPTSNHFDDTHNTLLYAERATRIKTKVVTRNVLNVDRHVGQYVEAINRLNIEVADLKAKLAGKRNTEADIERRKKAEAKAEVDRARGDIQSKADQTQGAIVDGATCAGKVSAAQVKMAAIRARLSQIDALPAPLSADLEAERDLLRALAAPEEQALRPDSALNARLQRSMNSANMFDAMLRAVGERRSDKLNEAGVEQIKLEARARKADLERAKAGAERDALRDALAEQAEMLVGLMGMLGRCTVMAGEAGRALQGAADVEAARAVGGGLAALAEGNDEAFKKLVGVSTASYAASASGSLAAFKGHTTSFGARAGAAANSSATAQAKPKGSRRSSLTMAVSSPGKKNFRSPRRAIRTSGFSSHASGFSNHAGGFSSHVRRMSIEKPTRKTVQWRDEAGRGKLDDAGDDPFKTAGPSAPPAPATSDADTSTQRAAGASESEWEDEKTEDSVHLSFAPSAARDSSSSSRSSSIGRSFLKSRGPALGRLEEVDGENGSPRRPGTRTSPLGDLSVNRMHSESGSTSGSDSEKGKGNNLRSPARRVPVGGAAKGARRRSNVGPMRHEKRRRSSSLIPQLSPKTDGHAGASGSGAARRVLVDGVRSPLKKPKRMSLLSAASRGMKARPLAVPSPIADPNMSISGGAKPAAIWR